MSASSSRILRIAFLGLPLVGALTACVEAEVAGTSESTILNGRASDRPDVVLFASSDNYASCSGTLIAPDVVLTAAHCLDGIDTAYFGYSRPTAYGELDDAAAGAARRYRIVDRVSAPGWQNGSCPMQGIDVALVRLESEVEGVEPAKLAERPARAGEECIVSGYGRHKTDEDLSEVEGDWGDYTSGEQREARVTVQPPAVADDGGAAARDDIIIAKGIDGAHSRGDSGGPLFCGGRVTGVVSCSPDRYRPVLELEKVYASVHSARAFIEDTQEKWRQGYVFDTRDGDGGVDGGVSGAPDGGFDASATEGADGGA